MAKRSLSAIGLLMVVAGLAASPSFAKLKVEATLQTPLEDARPGEQFEVSWTLVGTGDGEPQPFGAQGVFIKLFSGSGDAPTISFTKEMNGRTGTYWADATMPEGGIGALAIGLGGTSSSPDGESEGAVYFPVTNSPVPVSLTGDFQGSTGTPAPPPEDSSSGGSRLGAVIGALGGALALFTVGVFFLAWRRRSRSNKSKAERPGAFA